MKNLQFYVFFAVTATLVACDPVPKIRVPSAENDKAPVIKITNNVQTDGAVDKGEVGYSNNQGVYEIDRRLEKESEWRIGGKH